LLTSATMAPPEIPEIERLTYSHAAFGTNMFFLDQLLNRMPPPAAVSKPTSGTKGIGSLSRLPTEIILAILETLPVPDLVRFRRCNQAAKYCIESSTLLHSALRFVPNVVKAIMAIQPSVSITAPQLRSKLSQRSCDACGQLAQYLYVPTYSRACLHCIHPYGGSTFYMPFAEWEMVKRCELDPLEMAVVPSFRFLPCVFTHGVNKFRIQRSHVLYDAVCAENKRLERYETAFAHMDDETMTQWEKLVDRDSALHEQDPRRDEVTLLENPSPEALKLHMCVVFAPWIDTTSQEPEEGVFCTTCMYTYEQDRLYTKASFLEHLPNHCRVAPSDYAARRRRRGNLSFVARAKELALE
jgi:hypothetical protein